MSEHLTECGLYLFRYLRGLQVEAAYEGAFPMQARCCTLGAWAWRLLCACCPPARSPVPFCPARTPCRLPSPLPLHPRQYLSNEQLLIHDLVSCWWVALKHCSIRTAVPNR